MCGIFGYNGVKKPNLDYIKILGIFNEERGKDSSGIMIGNEIIKEIKPFTKFIQSRKFPELSNKDNFTIIGHTRKSSVGAVNVQNAHPFGFFFNETPNQIVGGVHNGTIYNIDDIEKEFNVKTDIKVDSAILIKALIENPSKVNKILSMYEGGAAIMINDTREPNTLHVFKGASKNTNYATTLTEERPLYIWNKSEEEKYFSSIKESLYSVGAQEEEVEDLPCNLLMTFKNGRLINSLKINREKSKSFKEFTANYYNYNKSNYNYYNSANETARWKFRTEAPKENALETIGKNRVFMMKLRYYINYYDQNKDTYTPLLLNGTFRIFPDGTIDNGITKNNNLFYSNRSKYYHFYNGLLLKEQLSETDIKVLNEFINPNTGNVTVDAGKNAKGIHKDLNLKVDYTLYFYLQILKAISAEPLTLHELEISEKTAFNYVYNPFKNFTWKKGDNAVVDFINRKNQGEIFAKVTENYFSGDYIFKFARKIQIKVKDGDVFVNNYKDSIVEKLKFPHKNTYNQISKEEVTKIESLFDSIYNKPVKNNNINLPVPLKQIPNDIITSNFKEILLEKDVKDILLGKFNEEIKVTDIEKVVKDSAFVNKLKNNVNRYNIFNYIVHFKLFNGVKDPTLENKLIELSNFYKIKLNLDIDQTPSKQNAKIKSTVSTNVIYKFNPETQALFEYDEVSVELFKNGSYQMFKGVIEEYDPLDKNNKIIPADKITAKVSLEEHDKTVIYYVNANKIKYVYDNAPISLEDYKSYMLANTFSDNCAPCVIDSEDEIDDDEFIYDLKIDKDIHCFIDDIDSTLNEITESCINNSNLEILASSNSELDNLTTELAFNILAAQESLYKLKKELLLNEVI